MKKTLVAVALLAFLTLTGLVLLRHGYIGFFEEANHSLATQLLMADLVICLVLIINWMALDAGRRGRRAWPFIVISVLFGAAGPLLYLLLEPEADS